MAKRSTRSRLNQEVNAGSMADIAFLLLIFFLVTTTIAEDSGVLVKLPPWSDSQEQDDIKMKQRNILSVLINAQDELLVEKEPARIANLRETVKEFIVNPMHDENKAEAPNKAVVSLQNDRGTKYKTYLAVYNELKAAYRELWEEEAMKSFHKKYQDLNREQQRKVRNKYPLVISEADPTEYGDEEK